jgi:hypothetical protein
MNGNHLLRVSTAFSTMRSVNPQTKEITKIVTGLMDSTMAVMFPENIFPS